MMRIAVAAAILLALGISAHARFPRGGAGGGIPQNNGGIILNLGGIDYYSGYNAFLNWFQTGDAPVIVSSVKGTLIGVDAWDDGTYFDTTTGELATPLPADTTSFARGFFTPVNYAQYQYEGTSFSNFAGEQFDVTWTGCSSPTLSVTGTLGTGGTLTPGSNSATITLGSSGYSNVALVFTFTGIPACYASPPKNIKITQNRYAANVAAGEVWNPDWLAAVSPFGYLRLMDWMHVNFGGISDISQLADFNYVGLQRNFAISSGIGSVSGTVLNLSGLNRGKFRVGQRIVCTGCPTNLLISSLGTGAGGAGTYNLDQSAGTLGSRVITGVPAVGQNWSYGPKGGVHPNVACALASAARTNIEFTFPIAASDQMVADVASAFISCMPAGLRVRYSYGNENWNTGFDTYYYVSSNATSNYSGYRAAEISAIIVGVYGTTSYPSDLTSRWEGSLGAQAANPAVLSGAISGANAYRTAVGSPYSMAQLFRSADIAPYWGNFYNGVCISNVTAAATPLVTIDGGCGNETLTNGQLVYVMVKGGTMAGVLNGVYATVSNYNGSTFNIDVDTTGLTYGTGTGNNGVLDAVLFKLIDQSTALNSSTPATYPTKFSYFAQQMSKAILNGSASDASYGTITVPPELNVSSSGLVTFFRSNALLAQAQGMALSQYEGGPTQTLVAAGANIKPNLAVEFLNVSLYDAGAVGDAVNTPVNVYNTAYAQFDSVNGLYQSQFNDANPMSNFGPWGAIRFFPGDTTNPKWSNIVARNALGPYSPNIPAPTGTLTYNHATDRNFGSAGATTLTCPVTSSPGGLLVVPITWANATSAITSVSVSGGVGNMTQDALTVNAWSAAIYSKAISAGSYTVTITWNSSAPFRNCYSLTLNGLLSGTALSATSGNPQKNTTIDVTSGAFIIAVADLSGAMTFSSDSTQGPAAGTVTQYDMQISDGQASGLAYWSSGPSFSSPLFVVATDQANGLAAATYK